MNMVRGKCFQGSVFKNIFYFIRVYFKLMKDIQFFVFKNGFYIYAFFSYIRKFMKVWDWIC